MKIVSVDEAGEIPLQRVLPWEKLVDQLAASRSYMELAGQHSGLGKLFLEHQQQVIELFKQHILLYGKGGELLFLEDVRRYFPTMSHRGLLPAGCCVKRYCRYFRRREAQPTIVLKLFQTVGGCTWDTLSRTMHRYVRTQPQYGTMCGKVRTLTLAVNLGGQGFHGRRFGGVPPPPWFQRCGVLFLHP